MLDIDCERSKKVKYKNLWANANLIRSLPAIIAYCLSKNKEIISKDILAWVNDADLEYLSYSTGRYLNWLLVYKKAFRNVFYNRIGGRLCPRFLNILYPRLNSLYLSTQNIGAGLLIMHGFSTLVMAKSIGENCTINQQVTVGFKNTPVPPVIGNNVRIGAGAIVIGEIHIGDNTTIGAGAVVTKSVPNDCVVVGNPAFILKRNGLTVNQPL